MNDKCFECNSTEDIHHHHVVPRSLGGTKTIPLCEKCHGKVHNMDFSFLRSKGLKEKRRIGIEKAKAEGKYKGTKKRLSDEQQQELKDMVRTGRKIAHVAKHFKITRATVYSYLKFLGFKKQSWVEVKSSEDLFE
jgi:hypothetical protein